MLVEAETALKQRKKELLVQDEADPTIIAKTVEVERLLADNQLAITDTSEQLLKVFRTPRKADDAVDLQSPQPTKEPGAEDATMGDPPDAMDTSMSIDQGDHSPEVLGLGGMAG